MKVERECKTKPETQTAPRLAVGTRDLEVSTLLVGAAFLSNRAG